MWISKKRYEELINSEKALNAERGNLEKIAENLKLILPESLRPVPTILYGIWPGDSKYNFAAIQAAADAVRNRKSKSRDDGWRKIIDRMNGSKK